MFVVLYSLLLVHVRVCVLSSNSLGTFAIVSIVMLTAETQSNVLFQFFYLKPWKNGNSRCVGQIGQKSVAFSNVHQNQKSAVYLALVLLLTDPIAGLYVFHYCCENVVVWGHWIYFLRMKKRHYKTWGHWYLPHTLICAYDCYCMHACLSLTRFLTATGTTWHHVFERSRLSHLVEYDSCMRIISILLLFLLRKCNMHLATADPAEPVCDKNSPSWPQPLLPSPALPQCF